MYTCGDEYLGHGVAEERLHVAPLFPTGQKPDPEPPTPRPPTGRVLLVGRLTDVKGGRFLVEALEFSAGTAARWPLTVLVVLPVMARSGPRLERQAPGR